MIRFEKVSFKQFKKDMKTFYPLASDASIEYEYEKIKLPKRSTIGSAGYDFYMPFDARIEKLGKDPTNSKHDYLVVPTGIRWVTDRKDIVLILTPRSGLGFKKGFFISNTLGVIDSDYAQSSNEGHIMVKFGARIDSIAFQMGDAFVQGIILPYITTDDEEEITTVRDGVFGSTDQKAGK